MELTEVPAQGDGGEGGISQPGLIIVRIMLHLLAKGPHQISQADGVAIDAFQGGNPVLHLG